MSWPERKLDSLQTLQELTAGAGACWPNNTQVMFRGQSDVTWSLFPSLARELQGVRKNWMEVARLESELFNQFRAEAHRELPATVFSQKPTMFDHWPLMGHFGAPARLLDWSFSPYVALYFAVAHRWETAGALWWFRASALENLMVRTFGAGFKMQEKLVFGDDPDAPFLTNAPSQMLFAFGLRMTIPRIGNQQGAFTVCLDVRADHAEVMNTLTTYADGPHCEKLIIPKDAKPGLLRELHLMNVTGKSMFPGLDGLGRTCSELTKLSVRFGGP